MSLMLCFVCKNIFEKLEKGRGHIFWGEDKVEICSTIMAFSGPRLGQDPTRGLPLLDILIDVGLRVIFYCMDSL